MLDRIPDASDMTALLGKDMFTVWESLCRAIEEKYDTERLWDKGYREWIYEYKYRRGGKTLCTLYAKENTIGLLIVFGKDERSKFEAIRKSCPAEICKAYDEAAVLHDGKWVMYHPADLSLIGEFVRLLGVKRRPNRR